MESTEQSEVSGDYYSSLLERVDGAIATQPSMENSNGGSHGLRSSTLLDQASVVAQQIAEFLLMVLAWIMAALQSLYSYLRKQYYLYKRGAAMPNQTNTPLSALRSGMERRDSFEL